MIENSAYESVEVGDYLDHEGIEYKRTSGARGKQFNIRECPACHNEKWKVYLNQETGYGNCFVCEKSFNLWTFAAAHIETDDKRAIGQHFDAVAKANGWAGKRATVSSETCPVFEGDLKLPVSIELPTPTGQTLKYLEARGFGPDIAAYFHLRYCVDQWWRFKKEDGTNGGVNFSERVIIPIYDLEGNLVTFQGRDITGTSDRKYLFPPRLPGTARFLYNGHNAYVTRAKHVVMGEGAADVWAIKAALDGDRSMSGMVPIGSFGMHLSKGDGDNCDDQLGAFLKLQKAGLETVTILWDGENKALTRALNAAHMLSKYGLNCRIGFLPQDKDPADVDAEVVREAIRNARPFNRSLLVSLKLRNPYRK